MDSRYHGKHNHVDRISMRALSARALVQGFSMLDRRMDNEGNVHLTVRIGGTQIRDDGRYTVQQMNEMLAESESAEVARILRSLPVDYSLWECLNRIGTRTGFMVMDDMGGLLFEGQLNSYEVVRELQMDEWRRGIAHRKAEVARESATTATPTLTDHIRSSDRRYD